MLLYEKPLHGYGIIKAVKERMGIETGPSLVYPFLRQLEKRGLVEYITQMVGSKPKKVYTLTEEGRNLALRVFKRLASIVSTAIKPNLSVCVHCGCKVYEGGYVETVDGKELTFCCSHCAMSYKQDLVKVSASRSG